MSKIKEASFDWEVEVHNTKMIFRDLTRIELDEKFEGLTDMGSFKVLRYTTPVRRSVTPLRPLEKK